MSRSEDSLRAFADRHGLEVEDVDGVSVAVENNQEQTLLLLESENASGAIAIDVSGVTLAEAIEAAPRLEQTVEYLARSTVFASDGRGEADA